MDDSTWIYYRRWLQEDEQGVTKLSTFKKTGQHPFGESEGYGIVEERVMNYVFHNCSTELLQKLLREGASPNCPDHNTYSGLALFTSAFEQISDRAMSKHSDTNQDEVKFRLLIQHGANYKDVKVCYPSEYRERQDHPLLVEFAERYLSSV